MPFVRFQFRRGTASQWTSANPILNDGEMAIETDTKKFKIGDGTTLWNSLAYGGLVGPQGSMSTDVSYNVNFGNAISVALDISLGGNLISKNDVSVNRYLRVSSDASFGSNIYVTKDISLGGNLLVGNQIGIGKVPTSGYALDMNGNIFLSGNIYTTGGGLYNSFNYNTDLSLNANLRIGVDASFGGNVFLSKMLNLKRVILVGGTSGSPVTVNPSTSLIELNGTVDGTNNYFTLGNGSYDGQTVTIVSSSSGVSDYLNATGGTNIKLNGASCTQIRFSNSFQSVDMKWSSGSSTWFVTSWQGVNFQGVNLNFGTYTTGDINLYAAVNTYVDSKLTVNKDGTFNSNLFVGKDSSLSGNLYVLNKTTFVGDSSHNAKLTVAGDASFGAKMTVLNDVSLNNRLTVAGDASYNGKLYVQGVTTLVGITNIVGDASFNSKLAVGGDVSLNSHLTVANDVSFGAKLTITNDVSLNSKLTVANDVSFGAKILVGGDASYNGKLYVQGATTLNGTTNLVGDASLNSKLTVAGDASFGAKVMFVNDVSLNSKLTVSSDVSFGSKFSVGGDASYNGKLYVQGVTTLFGTTNIVGDTSLNSKLAVGGDVSLNSRLTVANDVSFGSKLLVVNDVSLNSKLTVANDVSFGSKLSVGGDASYNGKLYVLSTTNLVGDASLNSKLVVGGDVSFNSRLTVANDVSMATRLFVSGNIAIGSNDIPLGALEIKGNSLASNAPDSGYNLLRLVSTKATGTSDPSYCMALGVDYTTGFGYINAAGKNVIRDVALQTRGGNVVIGNPGLTISTGKLHIYEPIGTDAANNGTNTFGSLVIEHGDASGASSIVFPSKKNLSNYAYLRYKDALSMPMSDYTFDLSTNITMASFINQGIVGGVATINYTGGLNGSLGYVTPSPTLIISGTSIPTVLNINQTNLISGDTQSIAYFTQSIVKTGNQITFNAWIKPNTVANTGCKYTIFQLSDSGNTDIFNFYINGADSKLYATIGNDTTNCINNSTVLGTSSWYHVAVTYDGAGVGKIYINGGGTTTNVGTGFTGKTSLGLYTKYMVGVNAGFLTGGSGNKGYNGLIAFVNINRYPLSQADIGNFASGTVNNGALIIGAESDVSGVNQDTIVLMSAGGNGFVGVNTMRPQYPLHVNGNTALFGAVGVGKAPSSTYVLDISGNVNFSGTLFNNDVVFTSGGGGTGPTLALTGNLFVGNSDLTPGARMRVFESTGTLAAVNGVGSLVIEHGNAGGGSSLVFPSALAKSTDYAYIQYKDNNDLPMSTIALDFSAGTIGVVGSDGTAIVNTGTYGGSVKVDLNGGSTSLLRYVATGSTPTTNRNASAALWFNNTNLTSGAANTTVIADLCGNVPDSDSLSFSAWIWPTTVTSTDCVFHIFQTYNNAGTTPVVRAFLQNGYFVVQLNNDRGYYKMSNTQLSTGQWTHVTFTYNGGGVGNIYLGGSVNERLISPLVLKYDFEASPIVNQGTFPDLNGTLTINTISSVQKKYGTSSMLCNGSGFLTIPSLSLQNFNNGITISFWFYPSSTGVSQNIVNFGGGIFTIATTTLNQITTTLGTLTLVTTGTAFTANTWNFYVLQIPYPNPNTIWSAKLNTNSAVNSASTTVYPSATYASSTIGSAFIGYIDDFRIYNSSSIVVADISNNSINAIPTPGYSGGSITTLNSYNTGFIGARPGYVATGSAGAAEYGIYQKGYAGYMNYFTFNNYNLSATEVSLLYNGNVDAGTLTIGIENDSYGVATDNIILLPAAGNGCVGINKKQPLYPLDVSGSVRIGADASGNGSVLINSGGMQTNKYGMTIDYIGDGATGYAAIWGENQGVSYMPVCINPYGGNVAIAKTTAVTALDVNGTVTATSFNATSDYRIKTDVRPLSYNNNIDLLKPVSYFNTSLNKRDIGFIAHEVQEVFPELVSGEKDGNVNQTLNYLGLIGVLTREIQGLKKIVAELKTEIEELKK